jgi:hypothetical protein
MPIDAHFVPVMLQRTGQTLFTAGRAGENKPLAKLVFSRKGAQGSRED